MAILRQFYSRHDRDGRSEFFALAREVMTDEVFVLHSRSNPADAASPHEEKKLSVAEFLGQNGPGRNQLLGLIGTLVVDE